MSTAYGAVSPDTNDVIVRSKFLLKLRLGLTQEGRHGLQNGHRIAVERQD